MNKKITLLLLIFAFQCFAQTRKNNITKNILASDLTSENLKGPVKSYHLEVRYVDLNNKYNNANRIATPKGNAENVFVKYNRDGLMTQSLLGTYNDSLLVLEPMEQKDLVLYNYNEYDLVYKKALAGGQEFPSMLDQRFYTIHPNKSSYRQNHSALKDAVHEIYGLNYDEDQKNITDAVFYRTLTPNKKLEGNENVDLDDKNLKDKWHFEYNEKGLLKKIKMQRDSSLDFIIKYFRFQIKTLKAEIIFDYDAKDRLIKYTVFTIKDDVREEIGSVKYSYNERNGFVETESLFKKYPDEYYLSNVHNYTRNYNKQGDLIASLLQIESKDEELVRVKQLYLDKYYEYTYDQNDNWIECKIRVNSPESEVSAIMKRKIEYFVD